MRIKPGISMFLIVTAFFVVGKKAPAAGVTTHFAMTREAVKKVSVPKLKKLLEENKNALMCGVSFPDFGTAVDYGTMHRKKPEFGGVAHRPVFVEAYFDRVRERCAPDYADCDRLLAHFMGVAAHGMEDDLYDELFMNKAQVLDPGGGRVNHDLWADEVFVVRYDPFGVVPRYYLPWEDLVEVYGGLGMEVGRRDLLTGKIYHWAGASGLRAIALIPYPYYSRQLSFTKANIVTHPGGIGHASAVIARYWEILWKRLQGAGRSDEIILETWPGPGSSGHECGHESLYSRVNVYFTTGMDDASITRDSFYIEDPEGKRLPVSIRIKHENDNFAALIPERDFEPGTTYTAVITARVKDMKGNHLTEEYSWSFTTSENW